MVASGTARSDDFNGPEQLGAGLYQATQKRGQRLITSDGYLRPARRRPNLTVLTGTRALRLNIDQGRVTGVDVKRAGKRAFPRIPHGNTHAPALMVGEKAADVLRSAS